MVASAHTAEDVPPEAWLLALAALPKAGPARLGKLLDGREPPHAWVDIQRRTRDVEVIAGSAELAAAWQRQARSFPVADYWQQHVDAGIGVSGLAGAAYPAALRDDIEPPHVLLVKGDLRAVHPLAVAVVGTRQCTRYGVDLAYELGSVLAEAGITVVSGLALGIDAAAHSGALDVQGAPPVAVVAGPLDRPYPRQNGPLFRAVAERGAVLSEAPIGTQVGRWRFPARNRIIAGLSLVTVVVESHATGGSLYTASAAVQRDRPVFAVPGPIRSPSSAGTNRLLADGHQPLCEPADVLVAVGLAASAATLWSSPALSAEQDDVLRHFAWQPVTLEELMQRSGMTLTHLAEAIADLEAAGLVVRRGTWLERTALSPATARG